MFRRSEFAKSGGRTDQNGGVSIVSLRRSRGVGSANRTDARSGGVATGLFRLRFLRRLAFFPTLVPRREAVRVEIGDGSREQGRAWETISPPTTAMPSGWRRSAPALMSTAIGSVPNSAAVVVFMMGRKRSTAAAGLAEMNYEQSETAGSRTIWSSAPRERDGACLGSIRATIAGGLRRLVARI
jgi:hypothetical protein